MNLIAIKRNVKWLILSGIFLGLNWTFLFAAYLRTTIAVASLCNYIAPLIIVLIAPLALNEPLNKKKLPYVFIAFIGIILVSGLLDGTNNGELLGIILGLLSAVCFVGIIICNRKIKNVPAFDKAVVQLAVSAFTVMPYALFKNYGLTLKFDTTSLINTLILGIVHTGAAYCLYFSGLGNLPVQTIAVLGYLEPVVSVFCSAFFLKESLMNSLTQERPSRITLDAAELEYISSSGLRLLLLLKKQCPDLQIINVSNNIEETLRLTGFDELLTVKRALREISIEGCPCIGRGQCGEVYRLDSDTVVKLFAPNTFTVDSLEQERKKAKAAFLLGVPTAISYEAVHCGQRLGLIFELVEAKSVREIVNADPSRLEELIPKCAALARHIHTLEPAPGTFPKIMFVCMAGNGGSCGRYCVLVFPQQRIVFSKPYKYFS